MTSSLPPLTPLGAIAARKRAAADRIEARAIADAARLRREADELEDEHARRVAAARA